MWPRDQGSACPSAKRGKRGKPPRSVLLDRQTRRNGWIGYFARFVCTTVWTAVDPLAGHSIIAPRLRPTRAAVACGGTDIVNFGDFVGLLPRRIRRTLTGSRICPAHRARRRSAWPRDGAAVVHSRRSSRKGTSENGRDALFLRSFLLNQPCGERWPLTTPSHSGARQVGRAGLHRFGLEAR